LIEIKIVELTGDFAEDKDIARDIRLHQIIPAMEANEEIILNFKLVNLTTQSFIHALFSDVIREYKGNFFKMVKFKSCNENVRSIIEMVVDYMQENII